MNYKPNIKKQTATVGDTLFRQYDKSDTIIGGKNIIEAFETNDIVIFNESYTIIGEKTSAMKISATYDLTIIGNIAVDEIIVNGNLTVTGDISAKKLTCANSLICQGNIHVDYLYVGSVIANSIKCIEFVCDENALIKTTIDIDEASKTEKTMVACEGIIGAGSFVALNAVANEYFEFSGNIQGKIIELESSTMSGEVSTEIGLSKISIEDTLQQVENRIKEEYKIRCTQDEDAISELLKILSTNSLHNLSDFSKVFEILTKISYQNEIDDFGDYLIVIYAKNILPSEIYRYETIEHIDSLMLPKAEKNLEDLRFNPKSAEHISMCINIAMMYADSIPVANDIVLDKIYSSIGLRYTTVKSILAKSTASNTAHSS